MKTRITQKDERQAIELLNSIEPVEGEERRVYKCSGCGQLFGRRFIPYAIGHGLTVNPCLCQITAHRPSVLVLEATP